ncbi:MarR family transcriptional regulator [Falsochrobactrum shanghaiense]|uniref:MarR family transcriptional regulator n=1 Tax=Falsochrobactrum shanghaiense TaxID=2201899 RepID=A0A316J5I5_9HYPH|nr:MarR family transcriptional regulator [Falsochrobactrum shanghaiense]PWL17117.1 MarR family transcriptional regulator [Falsochrobactrum shanghaiense]
MTHPCFCTLLRQAARRTSTIYDEALAPLGINVAQFSLLRRLNRAGKLSLTELARAAELDRSTVGRNAKVLQRMELIAPVDGEDHRETKVGLTDKGRGILSRGAPLWDRAQEEIETKLGNDGADNLQALLRAL